MMDAAVLDYEGIVLRKSDIYILQSGSYLNDRIIEFYFSYLANTFKRDDILLVRPSTSSSLAVQSNIESLKERAEPLKLDQRKIILFPVKDNDKDEDGSHWSLLVYYRRTNLFFHHDSLGGINHLQARNLYENIKKLVGHRVKGGKNKRRKSEAHFLEMFTPTDAYGYESGLYVLLTADTVCKWMASWPIRSSRLWFPDLESRVLNSYIQLDMRADVLELIDSFKEEAVDP